MTSELKTQLLAQKTKSITIADGVPVKIRKLKAGATLSLYAISQGEDAETKAGREVIHRGCVDPEFSREEADELDVDVFTELSAAILEFSGLSAGEGAADSLRDFPADGGHESGDGAGSADDSDGA